MTGTANSKNPVNVLIMDGAMTPFQNLWPNSFKCWAYPSLADKKDLQAKLFPEIQAVATSAQIGLSTAVMDALPNLKIIAIYGVGLDCVNLAEAKKRGIQVTSTPGILTEDVADLAVLMLGTLLRRIVFNRQWVEDGNWISRGNPPLATALTHRKVGILGMGHIGQAIAKRCAGFDMDIAYYNRGKRDVPYAFQPDLKKLAEWADALIMALPGTKETEGLMNREILDALGPHGLLVNIGRGSVVNEGDLVAALEGKRIGGAGLDVFQNEPNINRGFLNRENVLLSPHQGSATFQTRQKMAENVIENLENFFSGKPLLTPVRL